MILPPFSSSLFLFVPTILLLSFSLLTQSYEYPTHTDESLLCIHDLFSPQRMRPNQWDSEDDLWVLMQYWFKISISFHRNGKSVYMDVGSGIGRILVKYAHLFDKAIGIEPDKDRFGLTKESVEVERPFWFRENYSPTVTVHNCYFPCNFTTHTFTCISSIHVIQHIPTTHLKQFLRGIKSLLKPRGIAVIATTLADKERFEISDVLTIPRVLSEEEFNQYFQEHGKSLPVHVYTKESLQREMDDAGLVVVHWAEAQWMKSSFLSKATGTSQYVFVTTSHVSAKYYEKHIRTEEFVKENPRNTQIDIRNFENYKVKCSPGGLYRNLRF